MKELSPKEMLLGIAVLLLALAVGIFINPFIKDTMMDDVREHMKALQIDGDAGQFKYARSTSVGNVLAYGRISSVHPVTLPELLNSYSMVEKVTEKYTRHTREVCDRRDDDGDCVSSHTEVYYTWDTYHKDTFISDYFQFLSEQFAYTEMDLSPQHRVALAPDTVSSVFLDKVYDNCIYEEDKIWTSEGDLRYYYNFLPTEFNASMFVNFNVDNSIKARVYYERNRAQVLEDKDEAMKVFDVMYYLAWSIVLGGGYYWWAYEAGEIE